MSQPDPPKLPSGLMAEVTAPRVVFRPQAIERYRRTSPILKYREPRMQIPASIVSITLVGLLASSVFLKYRNVVSLQGWLVPTMAVSQITAHEQGYVTQLLVSGSDMVSKGEPLVVIASNYNLTEGPRSKKVLELLNLEAASIATASAGEHDAKEITKLGIMTVRDTKSLKKARIVDTLHIQEQLVTLAQNRLSRAQAVAQNGLVSKNTLEDDEASLLVAKQKVMDMEGEILDLNADILAKTIDTDNISAQDRANNANRDKELQDVRLRLLQAESEAGDILTSPIDGRIELFGLKIGQHVESNQTLATVLPADGDLKILAYAPSSTVGFIRPGLKMDVAYETFPEEQYGTQGATITQVSSLPIDPKNIGLPGLIEMGPMFEVTAQLDSQGFHSQNALLILQAGITLKARVSLQVKSFFSEIYRTIAVSRK